MELELLAGLIPRQQMLWKRPDLAKVLTLTVLDVICGDKTTGSSVLPTTSHRVPMTSPRPAISRTSTDERSHRA
jgi:hypothetical protein